MHFDLTKYNIFLRKGASIHFFLVICGEFYGNFD